MKLYNLYFLSQKFENLIEAIIYYSCNFIVYKISKINYYNFVLCLKFGRKLCITRKIYSNSVGI